MSIRSKIENRQAILVTSNRDGQIVLDHEDFVELCDLAHQAVHPESAPVPNDHSPRLAAQQWAEAWLAGPEEPESESQPPDESPEYDRGYDQARSDHHREFAVAYATQIVTAAIAAAHGLESNSPKVEDVAEGIYTFLSKK